MANSHCQCEFGILDRNYFIYNITDMEIQ